MGGLASNCADPARSRNDNPKLHRRLARLEIELVKCRREIETYLSEKACLEDPVQALGCILRDQSGRWLGIVTALCDYAITLLAQDARAYAMRRRQLVRSPDAHKSVSFCRAPCEKWLHWVKLRIVQFHRQAAPYAGQASRSR